MALADYVQGGGTDRAQIGAYLNPWQGLSSYVKDKTGIDVATTQLQQNATVPTAPTAPVTPQADTQSFAPVTPQAQTPVMPTNQVSPSSGSWNVGMEPIEHDPFATTNSSSGRGLYG